jgi:hypothetical protein
MTVTTDQDIQTFPGNDVATTFGFSVKSQKVTDIQATHISTALVETKLVQGTDFSVDLNDDGTSTINFPLGGSSFSTLATDENLEVRRLLPLTQTSKFSNHGPYNAQAVETALDRNTQMIQQNVPDMPSGIGRLVYWDADGEQQLSVTNSDLQAFLSGGISSNGDNFIVSIATLQLILSTGLSDGEFRYLTGFFQSGDTGLVVTYKWVSASSASADGVLVVIPDDTPANGRWIMETNGVRNVRAYGATGDGVTNDTAAFTIARTATGNAYYIPSGTYILDASPDVWDDPFSAGDNVTLTVAATPFDVSNNFKGQLVVGSWNDTVMNINGARSGVLIARISDGSSSSQSHQIFLPADFRTDSHFIIASPETDGGDCDILLRRSALDADPFGNRFNVTFESDNDRLLISAATTTSGAPSFDSAIQINGGDSGNPRIVFPALKVEFNQKTSYFARSGATFQLDVNITTTDVKWNDGTVDILQMRANKVSVDDELFFEFGSSRFVRMGTGSPEGNVTGAVGAEFHQTDGGAGTVLWAKESGTGNTGWASK